MATARAIANGNWSATATWNGGVLPGNGDTVYANGFIVAINQNVTIGGANNPSINAGSFVAGQWYEITTVGTTTWTAIGAASNTLGVIFLATGVGSGTGQAKARATLTTALNASAGAATGGGFTEASTYSVPCDLRAGTTNCLTLSGATNYTESNLILFGGNGTNQNALVNNGTGTVSVTSSTISAKTAIAIQNTSTGSVITDGCTITSGDTTSAYSISNSGPSPSEIRITGGTITGGYNGSVTNSSTGTVNISNVTISQGPYVGAAVLITGTGTVTITGSTLTGGSTAGAYALQSNTAATVICTNCTFTASSFSSAVNATSTTADYRFSGTFISAVNGLQPLNCNKWKLGTAPTTAKTRYALDGSSAYVDMFTSDNTSGISGVATTDVRSGISYGGGLVGTCAVPAAGSVALGVPVGSGTGTALLTGSAVASAVWDALTSSITTSGSIGERVKNCATVETTGEQLAGALSTP